MSQTIEKKNPPIPPKAHWLLGNVKVFNKDRLGFLLKYQEEIGDVFQIKLPQGLLYVFGKPEYVKHVLQENNKNYKKGLAYHSLRPLLGNGLLTSEGDFWRKQRRLAQPSFHKARIEEFAKTMIACVNEMLEKWDKNYKDGDLININTEMNHLALMIVSRSLFKSDISKTIDKIGKNLYILMEGAARRIRSPFMLPPWVPTPYNLRQKKSLSLLNEIIGGIIDNRRKNNQKYDDLLDMLMDVRDEDTGEGMDNEQLKDEVMTIFMAGHETTAVALAYAFLAICENPDVDERLKKEADTIALSNQDILSSIREQEYTGQIIHEVLRLYPPAWVVSRRAIEEDEVGGFYVPPKTDILMSPFAIQRNPDIWENPEKFDPCRFEKEKMKAMHRYAYFPFGGGPRLCIGDQFALMEMQVALPLIRKRYKFRKQDSYKLELEPLITMRPKNDIYLYIERV